MPHWLQEMVERGQPRPDAIHKTHDVEVVERDAEGGIITINTPTVDRDSDRVFSAGARLQNYAKNPVVLWGHNYREAHAVAGQTLRMEQAAEHLKAKFKLRPAANEYDPQNIVLLLWSGGWVRTASVGFAPVWDKTEENEFGGLDFHEWDLLEWSLVPVPANQEALRNALKGLGDAVGTVGDAALRLQAGAQPTGQLLQYEPQLVIVNHILGTEQIYTLSSTATQAKTVIPYKRHALADVDTPWDGAAQVRAAEVDDLKLMCTWYDGGNPDVKQSYKLPHHQAGGDHATVWRGVAAAMGALLGARGGVNIPDGDRRGVYGHLAKHYRDFDKEPPEFRNYDEHELAAMFPDMFATGPAGPGKTGDEPATAQPTGDTPAPAPEQGEEPVHDDALPSTAPQNVPNEPNTDEPAPGDNDADFELTPAEEEQVVDALLVVVDALRRPMED